MNPFDRRYRDLMKHLVEHEDRLNALEIRIASIQGKLGVQVREKNKKASLDAEIRSLEAQMQGKVVAWRDPDGAVHYPEADDAAS